VSENGMTGIERIAGAFANTGKRAALMPYVMGGYPTLADSIEIGEACVSAGADILELGMPYSDPLADGPVIHAAGAEALAGGANVAGVLEVARALAGSVPVVLMCYANMVMAPGVEAFVERLAKTGASGLIVPDLPLEESGEIRAACEAHGLALVPLVAPTTTPERFAAIGAQAQGFLYTVSVVGTTGERSVAAGSGVRPLTPLTTSTGQLTTSTGQMPGKPGTTGGDALGERFAQIVARAKASTTAPVALGFGISTPEDALRAAEAGADGVIVGTRLVRAAGGASDPAGAVGAVVGELAAGLARG
jgi:tryptophan synthase alpha chain